MYTTRLHVLYSQERGRQILNQQTCPAADGVTQMTGEGVESEQSAVQRLGSDRNEVLVVVIGLPWKQNCQS